MSDAGPFRRAVEQAVKDAAERGESYQNIMADLDGRSGNGNGLHGRRWVT